MRPTQGSGVFELLSNRWTGRQILQLSKSPRFRCRLHYSRQFDSTLCQMNPEHIHTPGSFTIFCIISSFLGLQAYQRSSFSILIFRPYFLNCFLFCLLLSLSFFTFLFPSFSCSSGTSSFSYSLSCIFLKVLTSSIKKQISKRQYIQKFKELLAHGSTWHLSEATDCHFHPFYVIHYHVQGLK